MAITDIVISASICSEMNRSPGTLTDVTPNDPVFQACVEMSRGDIGTLIDVDSMQEPCVELTNSGTILPNVSDVRTNVKYGINGTEFSGTLIVGGAASGSAVLSKDTTHARGGSGTCAKFDPSSTENWGYWHFYIPATVGTPFVFSFWHKISSHWNGLLAVTIYDTDQITVLVSSESVTLTDDEAYHQKICTQCTPTSVGTTTNYGMCLVRMEVKDGSSTGYVYIDDVGAA